MLQDIDTRTRKTGADHEISFWREFVASDRFKNNFCRKYKNPEIENDIDLMCRVIAYQAVDEGRKPAILDIGSGPVSMLSQSFPLADVDLRAADPLGDDYKRLWSNPEPERLIAPEAVAGEDLIQFYGENVFDIVHIRNALDHSTNPMTVIEQMIGVARPGGYLIIHGFENEAIEEKWHGYHQWNIARDDGDLRISGKDNKSAYRVNEHFRDKVTKVRCSGFIIPKGKGWCSLTMRKRLSSSRYQGISHAT